MVGSDTEKDPLVFGYGAAASIKMDRVMLGVVRVEPDSRYALGLINSGGVTPNQAFYIEPVLRSLAKPGSPGARSRTSETMLTTSLYTAMISTC